MCDEPVEPPVSSTKTNRNPAFPNGMPDSSDLEFKPQCDDCRRQGVKLHPMNNYLGIGLDAEISKYFHDEREKHPEHFRSRVYNKTVYAKAILSKIPTKSKYINNVISLTTENGPITLPNIQGKIQNNMKI
jgi:hypothetical protein